MLVRNILTFVDIIKFNFDASYIDDWSIIDVITREHFGNSLRIWCKLLVTKSDEVAESKALSKAIG